MTELLAPVAASATGGKDLAVRDGQRLAELAAVANREYQMALEHGLAMINHAILCGEALIEAQLLVPYGEWGRWLGNHFQPSEGSAKNYMRVARHKKLVMDSNVTTQAEALTLLQGISHPKWYRQEVQAEIRKLKSEERSPREIAEVIGVSRGTVYRLLTPQRESEARSREKLRRRQAAEKALQRQEHDRAARALGGGVSEAYVVVQKLARILNAASGTETNPTAKAALNSALHRAYLVEDKINEAVATSGYVPEVKR